MSNYKSLKGKILMENVIEYVRLLSDSYLGHTLPKEEPIQVRSPSLYFTLNRDFPAGFSGRTLHCGVGGVDLPDDFGELGILKDGNETALIVIDALVSVTLNQITLTSFLVSGLSLLRESTRLKKDVFSTYNTKKKSFFISLK